MSDVIGFWVVIGVGILAIALVILVGVAWFCVIKAEQEDAKRYPADQCRCCGKKEVKTTTLPFCGNSRVCIRCANEIMKGL